MPFIPDSAVDLYDRKPNDDFYEPLADVPQAAPPRKQSFATASLLTEAYPIQNLPTEYAMDTLQMNSTPVQSSKQPREMTQSVDLNEVLLTVTQLLTSYTPPKQSTHFQPFLQTLVVNNERRESEPKLASPVTPITSPISPTSRSASLPLITPPPVLASLLKTHDVPMFASLDFLTTSLFTRKYKKRCVLLSATTSSLYIFKSFDASATPLTIVDLTAHCRLTQNDNLLTVNWGLKDRSRITMKFASSDLLQEWASAIKCLQRRSFCLDRPGELNLKEQQVAPVTPQEEEEEVDDSVYEITEECTVFENITQEFLTQMCGLSEESAQLSLAD